MHITSLGHAETRSISIAAPPAIVFDLLSDPRRLPDWAPAFASTVEPDGRDWLVDSGQTRFRVRVQVSPEAGTVDLLRPGDASREARMRVLHNENGSEFVFTLIFPAGAAEDLIARQMATVENELRTVRDLCEAHTRAVA
jgi:uncharacterized protein YndB with AHSA1/START domain